MQGLGRVDTASSPHPRSTSMQPGACWSQDSKALFFRTEALELSLSQPDGGCSQPLPFRHPIHGLPAPIAATARRLCLPDWLCRRSERAVALAENESGSASEPGGGMSRGDGLQRSNFRCFLPPTRGRMRTTWWCLTAATLGIVLLAGNPGFGYLIASCCNFPQHACIYTYVHTYTAIHFQKRYMSILDAGAVYMVRVVISIVQGMNPKYKDPS